MRRVRTRALIATVVTAVAFGAPLSTGAAAAPSVSTCDHLVVAMTSVGGGDGAGYVTVLFVNAGGHCTMRGFPTVEFFSPQVAHLVGRDVAVNLVVDHHHGDARAWRVPSV